ncbi:hypothetical protein [Labrys monachus]|uniref:Uncharacterized protein n=1 Tax=Labrys monachus TaxID=217067 RepID=A0ABU0F830_9HYPH|nr:hypothetical protein [Labrys monachus]MDQ0390210.1 hypothetical protein [Labrys monachus]
MCANCGFPAAAGHWTEAGAATAGERLRARFRRAQVLQAVLPSYGLTAHDDGVVPGITVSTKTGHHVMTADLAEFWSAAERIGGKAIDPLDPRFVALGGGKGS